MTVSDAQWVAWGVEFVVFLVATFTASAAHEATHYFAAVLLRKDVVFVPVEWAVYHRIEGDLTLGDCFVQIAPVGVGLVVGAVALAVGWTPLWAIPGWILYTFWGIPNDVGALRTHRAAQQQQ